MCSHFVSRFGPIFFSFFLSPAPFLNESREADEADRGADAALPVDHPWHVGGGGRTGGIFSSAHFDGPCFHFFVCVFHRGARFDSVLATARGVREGVRNAPEAERWRRGRRAQARDVTSGCVARARSVGSRSSTRCYGARAFLSPIRRASSSPLASPESPAAEAAVPSAVVARKKKNTNRPPSRNTSSAAWRRIGCGAPRFGAVAPMTSALLRRRSVLPSSEVLCCGLRRGVAVVNRSACSACWWWLYGGARGRVFVHPVSRQRWRKVELCRAQRRPRGSAGAAATSARRVASSCL